MKKLYICGESATGKSYLLSLLDNHPQTIIYPFHLFGFSNLYDRLLSKFATDQYRFIRHHFNSKPDLVIPITNQKDGTTFTASLGQIIHFIIQEMPSTVYLFQSHFSKECSIEKVVAHSLPDNKNRASAPFDFDFFRLIDHFSSSIMQRHSKELTVEQLDNILYESFIQSVSNLNNKDINNFIFVICGANGPTQVDNLFKYYSNFQILLMERDPIAVSYANTKRMLSKTQETPSNREVFDFMIQSDGNKMNKASLLRRRVENYLGAEGTIKIIDFDSLIVDPEHTMVGIADFLQIDFSDTLLEPSILGQSTGVMQIVDNPYEIFSKYKMNRLQNIFHGVDGNTPIFDKLIWVVDRIFLTMSQFRFIRKIYNVILSR